jgi:hypothetical protein
MLIDELKASRNVFTTSTKYEDMSMDPVDSAIKKDAYTSANKKNFYN